MKKILFGLIFCLLSSLLARADVPEYPCYQLGAEPALDGKIEDGVWSNIPAVTGFFILGDNYAICKQTYFKAGWDKEAVYIAVRAEEPEPEKMLGKLKDGGSLWTEDSIEFFIFPYKVENYFHFVVNSIGSRVNAIGRGSPQPVGNWQAGTYTGEDFWSLEARIPFSLLGKVPGKEGRWSANIVRNVLTGPASERYTSWSSLKKSFHEISNFGSFVFKEKTLSSKEAAAIGRELNFSYYDSLPSMVDSMREKVRQISQLSSIYRVSIEKGIKKPEFQKEALSLKKIWQLVEAVSNKKGASVRELCSVSEKSANLLERSQAFLDALKNTILMESLFEEE